MPQMLVLAPATGAPKKPLMPSTMKGAFSQTDACVRIFATNARHFQRLCSVRKRMSSHPHWLFRIYFRPLLTDTRIQLFIRHHVISHKELLDAVTLILP
jgi:hypothetical protein